MPMGIMFPSNEVKLSLGDFNIRTYALCVRRYLSGGIPDEDR